MVLGTGLVT
uniref:Uncharacterized protein n=1 Tax=Anguilla anguilla TaxID=7936 RepID=A0A0E9SU16_ANGAN